MSTDWHLRLPTTEHYQWFKNLVDLHALTLQCVQAAEEESSTCNVNVTRGLTQEVAENLWMLDSLIETQLDDLLDDTHPSDLLGRLEHAVWANQALKLNHRIAKTTAAKREALESTLDQSSFQLGQLTGQKRWENSAFALRIPRSTPLQLRELLLAIHDSPFAGYPRCSGSSGFLIKRSTETELQIELQLCPHRQHYPEVKPSVDRLCRLHSQWMRGFIVGIHPNVGPNIQIEHWIRSPRCIQRWFYP
jgi:hypothetical protein